MGRELFGVEKGLGLFDENGVIKASVLQGSGAPGGDAGDQDAALISSIYLRTDSEGVYKKKASGTGADKWELFLAPSIAKWRQERVRAATNDVVAAGAVDPSGWSDNESAIDDSDFSVGDFILGDVDGTPALFEVTALPGAPNITVAAADDALADGDIFMNDYFLPDTPAAQEAQALLYYSAGAIIKIADFNWAIADGISLTSGYAASSGNPTSSDTVDGAIRKIDGNVDALNTLTGRAQGSTHMSTYTGDILTDNQDI
ncbi:MAG: hypothetical protein ACTSRU_18850, partial [Candidatus Hodarchaeales archaeon]